MVNTQAISSSDNSDPANDNDTAGQYPENFAQSLCKIVRNLMGENEFNCKSCGFFFKTAAYSVLGRGTVCQNCLKKNKWQGERLAFFNAVLKDLPIVLCNNAEAGCKKVVLLPEDLEAHLKDCKYRPVNCISSSCPWEGIQDDLVNHFEKKHWSDVIDETDSLFKLSLVEDSFVKAKLMVTVTNKYFLLIRRHQENSENVFYNAFTVKEGEVHDVSFSHRCKSSRLMIRKKIETEQLNTIDKTCALHKVDVTALMAIAGDKSVLHLTVKVAKSRSETCSGCGETIGRLICPCGKNVCGSCSSGLSECPDCRRQTNRKSRNSSTTSDLYHPCAYRLFGCEENLLGTEVKQHESKCAHGVMQWCPLPNCSYENRSEPLFKQHVSVEHKAVLQGNRHEIKFGLEDKRNTFKNHVYYDGDLFEMTNEFLQVSSHMPFCAKQVCTYHVTSTVRSLETSSNKRAYIIDVTLQTFDSSHRIHSLFCNGDILIPSSHAIADIFDQYSNIFRGGAPTSCTLGFTLKYIDFFSG